MKKFEMPEIEVIEMNVIDVIVDEDDWTSLG